MTLPGRRVQGTGSLRYVLHLGTGARVDHQEIYRTSNFRPASQNSDRQGYATGGASTLLLPCSLHRYKQLYESLRASFLRKMSPETYETFWSNSRLPCINDFFSSLLFTPVTQYGYFLSYQKPTVF